MFLYIFVNGFREDGNSPISSETTLEAPVTKTNSIQHSKSSCLRAILQKHDIEATCLKGK